MNIDKELYKLNICLEALCNGTCGIERLNNSKDLKLGIETLHDIANSVGLNYNLETLSLESNDTIFAKIIDGLKTVLKKIMKIIVDIFTKIKRFFTRGKLKEEADEAAKNEQEFKNKYKSKDYTEVNFTKETEEYYRNSFALLHMYGTNLKRSSTDYLENKIGRNIDDFSKIFTDFFNYLPTRKSSEFALVYADISKDTFYYGDSRRFVKHKEYDFSLNFGIYGTKFHRFNFTFNKELPYIDTNAIKEEIYLDDDVVDMVIISPLSDLNFGIKELYEKASKNIDGKYDGANKLLDTLNGFLHNVSKMNVSEDEQRHAYTLLNKLTNITAVYIRTSINDDTKLIKDLIKYVNDSIELHRKAGNLDE